MRRLKHDCILLITQDDRTLEINRKECSSSSEIRELYRLLRQGLHLAQSNAPSQSQLGQIEVLHRTT
ncbi:hypothetical protein BC938DRAFT_481454 [Jimgerdemannia flammicorona]|uniref:Uncharacterized protein n=1 Tax=Jimgerdemannia flammicorona TaxID=994334 RepID=A0A433QX18_9FUNG|nr:hypothetical protein BC938DRAFT_481454 [Jimgerdemannia flammicorona]